MASPEVDDDAVALDAQYMEALAAPTPDNAIHWRPGNEKKTFYLAFVDESFIRFRLDSILGPTNWQCDTSYVDGCVKTILEITLPSGRVISRSGVSGFFAAKNAVREDVNSMKSAETDSFKRAATRFGIANDLKPKNYHPDNPVPEDPRGQARSPGGGQRSQGPQGAPRRRDLGSPSQGQQGPRNGQGEVPRAPGRPQQGQHQGPPRTGRALFAWIKSQEERFPDLVDWLNNAMILDQCPFERIIDMDAEWTKWGYESCMHEINRRKDAGNSGAY